MHVAISGSSGFVGSALCKALQSEHRISRLTRPSSRAGQGDSHDQIAWDPERGVEDPSQLTGVDAIVHLAGRSIASARWTEAEKQRIRDSRVSATERLVEQIIGLPDRPRIFISASAIGIYGDCGTDVVDEDSPVGDDFLAGVAADWEAASRALADYGVRVAYARLGIVLGKDGGALKKVLPLFRAMLGGRLGSGQQFWSWVALQDCVAALSWMLSHEQSQGIYNVVSPQPVTNQQFTSLLSRQLGRPAVIPAPAMALRLAMGEMADALLLQSCRVAPKRLLNAGFRFEWPELGDFLASELV